MPVTHEPWLVALSVVVAIQGAYVGLSLAVQISTADGARRRVFLAGAAISLAVAIWAMHFVAMLAARLPFQVDYLVFPTLLSFLVCVLVVGIAVFAVTAGPLTRGRLAASAAFMGLGIVSMHYIGMTAVHASAHMTHEPFVVALGIVVAIAASGLALGLAATRSEHTPLFFSAAALGIAISGMHYTAMSGVIIFPHDNPPTSAPALSSDLLAIVVAVVAFIVSGLFLLILVPDRSARSASLAPEPAAPGRGMVPPPVDSALSATTRSDGLAPRQVPASDHPHFLPVERDGTTHHLSVDNIVAVRANAHYTYVFDGTGTYFCPLAISDVEGRLDARRFARVHRSHIIAIDRIVRLKRAGDNGLIELGGRDAYTVPVSRGRLAWVKSQIGLHAREAAS
jgi:NO-binding membrane sensor protein with MHYT domain